MKFKLTKKVRVVIYLYVMLIILAVIMAVYAGVLHGIGYHNVDLGQNIEKLNFAYGLNLTDSTSTGESLTGIELYNQGQNQINKAFLLIGVMGFLIGFALNGAIEEYGRNQR